MHHSTTSPSISSRFPQSIPWLPRLAFLDLQCVGFRGEAKNLDLKAAFMLCSWRSPQSYNAGVTSTVIIIPKIFSAVHQGFSKSFQNRGLDDICTPIVVSLKWIWHHGSLKGKHTRLIWQTHVALFSARSKELCTLVSMHICKHAYMICR